MLEPDPGAPKKLVAAAETLDILSATAAQEREAELGALREGIGTRRDRIRLRARRTRR